MSREQKIIRTSYIGILVNVLLAAFKAGIGVLSHSVAIMMDAVNNLSDALSSVITIIGTKLASRAPDEKHPLGHGRIEYLSALIIGAIVLYAGITAFVESVKKIIHPEVPDYAPVSLLIIAVAVVAKILLGLYVRRTGREVNSDALVASGSDALFDSIISASTLVAAVIFLISGVSLESWLGAIISVVIIKAGYEQLQETISEILGRRLDPETARAVKKSITSVPGVLGAYDLIVHSYGPERMVGSVHIEVAEDLTARDLDTLERTITDRVCAETGVIMGGISVYSLNTNDSEAMELRKAVSSAALSIDGVKQVHGFYLDKIQKRIRLDAVIAFGIDRGDTLRRIREAVAGRCPDYGLEITADYDITD